MPVYSSRSALNAMFAKGGSGSGADSGPILRGSRTTFSNGLFRPEPLECGCAVLSNTLSTVSFDPNQSLALMRARLASVPYKRRTGCGGLTVRFKAY